MNQKEEIMKLLGTLLDSNAELDAEEVVCALLRILDIPVRIEEKVVSYESRYEGKKEKTMYFVTIEGIKECLNVFHSVPVAINWCVERKLRVSIVAGIEVTA